MVYISEKASIAVLDDDNPGDWCPWGTAVRALNASVEGVRLELPSYRERRFRFTLLMHPPEVLFDRQADEWEHVVGAVVDGTQPSGAKADLLVERFNKLCQGVVGASGGWYRRLGFYVAVASGPGREGLPQFIQRLRDGALAVLGPNAMIEMHPVEGDQFFLKVIEMFNTNLIERHIRSSWH